LRLAIDQIIVSKDNPRQSFDEEGLRRLGESIKTHGQLQAIIVRRRGQSFELIVGERRLRASALVGLSSIDAEVRDVDDITAKKFRLIENTQREDLSDAEKGDAVLGLWAEYDEYETLKDVAEAINTPYSTVKDRWVAKSKKLSEKLKGIVADASLTNEHAQYLMRYSHSVQDKLADVIIRKGISSHKDVLRPFLKSYDANPSADLEELADKALGIETVTVPVDKIPKEVLDRINEEKEQLAKVRKIRTPRKKPSKPITKEQVKQKFEAKKNKIANSTFKFEKVRVSTGKKNSNSSPLKREIKPLIIHNENTPDYSLCQCANCPLYAKHCKGRCWND